MSGRDIKHCPFCGSNAVLEAFQRRERFYAEISCCGCRTNIYSNKYDTEQEAVDEVTEAWNTRYNDCDECPWLNVDDWDD